MNESEFQIIKERVKEKEAHEELKKPEELIVKETIGERIEETLRDLPPTIPEKISNIPHTFAPLSKEEEIKKEIQELVEIALDKGIPFAVNLARKSGNYLLIDGLHDNLVKYYIEKNVSEKEL